MSKLNVHNLTKLRIEKNILIENFNYSKKIIRLMSDYSV